MSLPSWPRCNFRVALFCLLTVASVLAARGTSHAQMQNVNYNGMNLGILNITGYGFAYGKPDTKDEDPQIARGNIQANFTAAPAATNFLQKSYVPGLAYMQTVTFTFASGKTQQIFKSVTTGNPLTATYTDGPQGGYLYRNGDTSGTTNLLPFYNGPPNAPGATPVPKEGWNGNQFSDTPGFSFLPDFNPITEARTPGIGTTLNGMNGSVSFETALVGVVSIPSDKKSGVYQVNVLQSFTWGATFTFNQGGDPDNASGYTLAAMPLKFTNGPSQAFLSAFDQKGPNANLEWLVSFTPEPGVNALLFAAAVSLPTALWKRRKRGNRGKRILPHA